MRSSRKLIGAIAAVAMATGAFVATAGPTGAGGPPLELFNYVCVGADSDSQEIVDFVVGVEPGEEGTGVINVQTGVGADVPASLLPGEDADVSFFWQLALSDEAIQTARGVGITSIDLTDISLTIDIAGGEGDSQVVGTPPNTSVNIENDPVNFPVLGPFTGNVVAGDEFDIVYLLGAVQLTVFLPAFQLGFSLVCGPETECLLADTFVTGVAPDVDCPIPPRPIGPTNGGDDDDATTTTGPDAAAAATPRFTG
jgi:hypothetical protein